MHMKRIELTNPFKNFEAQDYVLLSLSIIVNFVAFAVTGFKDPLTFITAVTGIVSLLFNAKGHVFGQFVGVAFAIIYSVISFYLRYYGELITYAFMTGPIAVLSIITWLKNPYKTSGQVAVASLTKRKTVIMWALAAAVTAAFFFVLRALDTPNLAVSTVSIATSFLACYLMLVRSPWFAVAYAANDIVLIVLWTLATVRNFSYLPMVTCFSVFLFNDIYSFLCWCKMKKSQSDKETSGAPNSDASNEDKLKNDA